jgi:Lon protease-like protein
MKNHPLFPMNFFLLPGEFTQLYIFEDRYKQLVKECFKEGGTFGIPYSF